MSDRNTITTAMSTPPAAAGFTLSPTSTSVLTPGVSRNSTGGGSAHVTGREPSRAARRVRKAVKRSCMVCHQRKVRCDKTVPCANCLRAGVLCCYPTGERSSRQRKTTIADIASRLVQLERTIVAVSGGDAPTALGLSEPTMATMSSPRLPMAAVMEFGRDPASDLEPETPTPAASPESTHKPGDAGEVGDVDDRDDATDNHVNKASEEILLRNRRVSRYINEVLLSRLMEEEQDIQSILALPREHREESDNDNPLPQVPANSFLGTLASSRSLSYHACIDSLLPSKQQAMQLWQVYLSNVEILNKFVHVPTTEVEVFTAIRSPDRISPAHGCLLFAIYFAAMISCQPEDCQAMFGRDKAIVMEQFRAGLELSLTQSNFLEAPSFFALQGLSIFLRTSRAQSPGRSAWILYGMAIRAAQSVGLHCDGENFHLSPFESELRRRIWWHLIGQDARAAEDHGISVRTYDAAPDVSFPRNLNDSDLDPEMKELPPAQTRWTDTTLAVCLFHMCHLMMLFNTMFLTSSAVPTEAGRQALLDEHLAYVDQLEGYCNPVVPVQRAAQRIIWLVKNKLKFVSSLQLETAVAAAARRGSGDTGGNTNANGCFAMEATERRLVEACRLLEVNDEIQRDEMLQNLRWSSEMYPQYHAMLYILWHLCVRPSGGQHIERAWRAIDTSFDAENSRRRRQSKGASNSKWAMLTAMRDKARRIRAAAATNPAVGQDGSSGSSGVVPVPIPVPVPGLVPVPVPVPMRTQAPVTAAAAATETETVTATDTSAVETMPHTGFLGGTATIPGLDGTDMTAFLVDASLGEGLAWDSSFMDWAAVANDFQSKDFGPD